LDNRKDAVIPDFRQTELRNAVEKLSGDLCISRPKSRLDWGIELPFDKDFVTYVWFDALTNYISFAGYDPSLSTLTSQPSTFRDKWPALQIIGKDVLVPAHGIYWLIMLHAIGFPDDQMPQLLVHGWWNVSGAKMSKSVGNIVDPFVLSDKYSADALRYYLMSDMATGQDADFSEERLVERYNSDLANNVGNLANRTLNMIGRYLPDRQLRRTEVLLESQSPVAGLLHRLSQKEIAQSVSYFKRDMDDFDISIANGMPINLTLYCNGVIEEAAPWNLSKQSGAESKTLLAGVLYHIAETLRIIAILISPVLPKAAHGIFDQLNWKMELSGKEERFSLADAEWGRFPDGHVVGKPTPLFPRIETT
jgi:methionyl-tRNA synthetase